MEASNGTSLSDCDSMELGLFGDLDLSGDEGDSTQEQTEGTVAQEESQTSSPTASSSSSLPTQTAYRFTYLPEIGDWKEDTISIQLEPKPFAAGAMRSAYRMKIVEANGTATDWVAKGYTKPQENEEKLMKDDVILQMSALHFGEQYSMLDPPKKVELIPAYLIRLTTHASKFLCIEPMMEGEFLKYNTNSGFVDTSVYRNTPHTFSHFSFEHSHNKMMVVDVQGVGDKYTDPQIHTAERGLTTKFGEGNLGIRGIALFFYTHQCNPLCKSLGLKEFPLYDESVIQRNDSTPLIYRTFTMPVQRKADKPVSSLPKRKADSPSQGNALLRHSPNNARLAASKPPQVIPFDPDNVPKNPDVFALIHYELARLHKVGRLAQIDKTNYDYAVQAGIAEKEEFDATPDTPAAFYHFQKAAQGGCVEAALALANIHKTKQTVFDNLNSVSLDDPEKKLMYLKLAADRWCQSAIYHYANAHYSGTDCERDWPVALLYFEKLVNPSHEFLVINNLDEFYDWEVTFTPYEVKAKMAEMLGEGGYGLEEDAPRAVELYYEAAEDSVKAGKGKLSMQYYEAAAALE